ncbi:hypothetical protein HDU86_005155 [Geranomyces michiganensis]|nr:hypothetical protein HDU86_005155 [Geranomyces michiganensis]
MSVVVTWQGEPFDVPFNEAIQRAHREGDSSPNGWAKRATLGDLVNKCSQGSKVPKDYIKLSYGGAVMKDLNATLSSYGIKRGAKILMRDDNRSQPVAAPSPPPAKRTRTDGVNDRSSSRPSDHTPTPTPTPPPAATRTRTASASPQPSRPNPVPPPAAAPVDESEDGIIAGIEGHLAHVREIALPIVQQYVEQATAYIANATSDSVPTKQLRDLHAKAGEVLLQRMIKLDGVTCAPGFDRARAKRKEAVRFIQSQLDIIDDLKKKVRDAAASKGSL